MEYTIQWKNGLYYPAAVIDKHNGMIVGIISLDEKPSKPSVIRASMYLDYGFGKARELEEDTEEKSWGLNPELAAEAIWKYHLKHMSWKKRLRRWYRRAKTIWNVVWKAVGVVAAAFLGAASSDDIDVLQYVISILE